MAKTSVGGKSGSVSAGVKRSGLNGSTGNGNVVAGAEGSGGNAVNSGRGTSNELGTARPKKKSRFDENLFLKYSKPCHSKYNK